jgi:hypothetical protein
MSSTVRYAEQEPELSTLANRLTMTQKQFLVLMATKPLRLPINYRVACSFVCHEKGSAGRGFLYISQLRQSLEGTHALEEQDGFVRLSVLGMELAQWIVAAGEKADFFTCRDGEWGAAAIDPLGLTQVLSSNPNMRKNPEPFSPPASPGASTML